jgi:hypothetical protein
MKSNWVLLEIYEDKASQAIWCKNYDSGIEFFKKIVAEYGVEPYEEMINENIFCTDDGYVVQLLELK